MSADETETQLATSSMKMQTLLHQFIQLYDRLTVEHSLMTNRELKIIKDLVKLTETIEKLDLTITELQQLDQQLQVNVQESIRKEVKNNFNDISNNIIINMDKQVTAICYALQVEHRNMQSMVHEYKEMQQTFSLREWGIALLIGFVFGLSFGFIRDWQIKNKTLEYWNNFKSNNINQKK